MQLSACASCLGLCCRRQRWTPGSRRQIQATGITSSSSPTMAGATATPPRPPLQVLWLCLTFACCLHGAYGDRLPADCIDAAIVP